MDLAPVRLAARALARRPISGEKRRATTRKLLLLLFSRPSRQSRRKLLQLHCMTPAHSLTEENELDRSAPGPASCGDPRSGADAWTSHPSDSPPAPSRAGRSREKSEEQQQESSCCCSSPVPPVNPVESSCSCTA